MRIATSLLGLTAAALVLAGCSGSDAPTTAAPSPTSSATQSSPTSSVGNLDDPLCAAAQDSIATAGQLESKTSDLANMLRDATFLTSDDATDLNAWGDDMVELSSKTLSFYQLGVTETSGEDVNADFEALSTFVTAYTQPLAQAAASAETPAAFVSVVQTNFSSAEVQEAASAAPSAARNVAAYLGTRCGIAS